MLSIRLATRTARLRVVYFSTDTSSAPKGAYDSLKSSKEFEKKQWVTQSADYDGAVIGEGDRLDIDGHPVMQRWETPYMGDLAKVATSLGGRVMEVGFGMGISATAIQSYPIEEHIVLEANAGVFERLGKFAQVSPHKVTAIGPGLWQDTLPTVADNSVDGILYDTYPLNKEEQHVHQFDFIGQAFRTLKPGGILTYCNLTSLGVLRYQYDSWEELFEKTQLPYLLKCGFRESDISFEIAAAAPDADCEYYQHNTALVPICRKAI